MKISVLQYTTSGSPIVQAFVDIELDSWLRFNGLNLFRDGSLDSAQLTRIFPNGRSYRPAVEILDADLRELLAADILAAIRAYIATLPPDERTRPPRPPQCANGTMPPRDSRQSPETNGKRPLAPPVRLMADKRATFRAGVIRRGN